MSRDIDVPGVDVGRAMGTATLRRLGRLAARVQERRPLPADLLEREDAYLVVVDAPGARPGDVTVEYEDRAVDVRIERFRDPREEFEMRFPGRGLSLDSRVELPPDATVDPGEATATLADDGTLRVWLPKPGDASAPDGD
ncbi:MAG: Hsp20/alpha crystallin family protein [Halobacteriaceae archaeon]